MQSSTCVRGTTAGPIYPWKLVWRGGRPLLLYLTLLQTTTQQSRTQLVRTDCTEAAKGHLQVRRLPLLRLQTEGCYGQQVSFPVVETLKGVHEYPLTVTPRAFNTNCYTRIAHLPFGVTNLHCWGRSEAATSSPSASSNDGE